MSVGDRVLADAVSDLEAAGLEVDEVLDVIGVVTGRAAEDTIERMSRVRGVTVEPEADVQLPPPDAPVQ
nr:hypothetical protein [Agromyces marinus]